jgi:hypothetical protein
MPRGGARPGAGKPKGYKHAHTIEKDIARKHLETRVIAEWDNLIDAQLQIAKGVTVMFARERQTVDGVELRSGRWYRVTDANEAEQLLNESEEGASWIRITVKDPDGKMLTNLTDRVTGKVVETIDVNTAPQLPKTVVNVLALLGDMAPEQLREFRARLLTDVQP